MFEGFDLQCMAFAAPEITREWHLQSAVFGPVFSGGLFGGLIGGFLVGALGSRISPKTILLLSIAVFSVFTTTTIFANSTNQLLLLRVVAGIGLGAAVPGVVAVVASYAPIRIRATAVTFAISCQLLGAVLGGAISSHTVPVYGWRSAFLLGGISPMVLMPFLILLLPQPLWYLARSGGLSARMSTMLIQMKRLPSEAVLSLEAPPSRDSAATFGELLTQNRASGTVFLWTTCIVGAMLLYFLVNWLPSILRNAGAGSHQAIMGSVALNAGGILGAVTLSRFMDRINPFWTVVFGYSAAVAFIIVVGYQVHVTTVSMVIIFCVGFFGLGAQTCITALIVKYYPAHLHNVAVGCAVGFARIGAVIGPLFGSYILMRGGTSLELFQFAAIASGGAALATFSMSRTTGVAHGGKC